MRDETAQSLGWNGGAIRINQSTSEAIVAFNHIELPVDYPMGATYISMTGIECVSGVPSNVNRWGNMTADVTFPDPVTNPSEKHLAIGNVIVPDPNHQNPPYGGGTHPISLYGAQKCRIIGNYINGGSHRAIILSPLSHENIIEGNYCEGFQSTGIHLAFGSSRNIIAGNTCKTVSSALEGNVIKGYFGCSENHVGGNYCEGSVNAGIRFAVKSNNNTVEYNHIKGCGVGIEVESFVTPSGCTNYCSDYPYNNPDPSFPTLNPVTTEGNVVKNNTVFADLKRVGIRLAQRDRTTVPVASFPLRECTFEGNTVIGAALDQSNTLDDYVLVEATSGNLKDIIASNNSVLGSPTRKWVLPRALSHFAQFDNGGNTDGWVESAVGWTYISGNSFRMLGDWTKYVSVGDKVRFKQSEYTLGDGFKYGYVIAISSGVNTSVQVVLWRNPEESPPTYSDVISDSPITEAYFSKAASPPGHPIWFKYNPNFTGFTAGQAPAVDALFMIQGRECVLSHQTTSTGNSNANVFTVTAKVKCVSGPSGIPFYAAVEAVDGGTNLPTPGKAVIGANSDIITLYKDFGFNANTWSTSGTKRANFTLVYRI